MWHRGNRGAAHQHGDVNGRLKHDDNIDDGARASDEHDATSGRPGNIDDGASGDGARAVGDASSSRQRGTFFLSDR